MNARIVLALLVAACLPAAGFAEISTDAADSTVHTIILNSITDGPDPIGIWLQYRSIAANRILNPDGDARGDGPPDITYLPPGGGAEPNGRPAAIWAYNAGIDHDIAFSEWSGGSWGATEFLTAAAEDELDPRIVARPDGELHAVWWTAGAVSRVYWTTRPGGSSAWGVPVEVVTGGRRPSVAVVGGTVYVAYQRDSTAGGMVQDVVVVRREVDGSFTEEFATSTTRGEPLDAVLHETAGTLWLDWKHEAELFGCAERGPASWGPVEFVGWPDPTWIGVEQARKIVRGLVLGN